MKGSKDPYKNIKPYPTKGPQGQLVNPTANNGKGPQNQRIDIESTTETVENNEE